MRIISSEELDLVAGGSIGEQDQPTKQKDDGGFFGALGAFFGGLFGGDSGSNTCVPSSNTANGVTTTQTCGANGVSTTTISGPGYVVVQNTVPKAGGSASIMVGGVKATGSIGGGASVTTTSIVNGRVSNSR